MSLVDFEPATFALLSTPIPTIRQSRPLETHGGESQAATSYQGRIKLEVRFVFNGGARTPMRLSIKLAVAPDFTRR